MSTGSEPEPRSATELLRWGLRHTGDAGTLDTLSDSDAARLAAWANGQRLSGLACAALGAEPSRNDFDGWRRSQYDHHVSSIEYTVRAEATALWVTAVLDAIGAPHAFMKGLVVSRLDYPDPSWRSSFDVDLLVARAAFGPTVDALVTAGCRRTRPPIRVGWERRFARAVSLDAPGGAQVDVHASLAEGYYGVRIDHDAMLGRRVLADVGTTQLPVLAIRDRLLSSSSALVLSARPELRYVRDIAQIVDSLGEDWPHAVVAAGPAVPVVAESIRRAAALLGSSHPMVRWADACRSPRATALTFNSIDRPPPSWIRHAIGATVAMQPRDAISHASGLLWPDREWLVAMERDRVRHLTGPLFGFVRSRRTGRSGVRRYSPRTAE